MTTLLSIRRSAPRLVLALLAAGAAFADAEIKGIQSTYNLLLAGNKIGVVTETFTRQGDQYQIESAAHPVKLMEMLLPSLSESSRGSVTPAGLKPLYFSHRRGDDERRHQEAEFHWESAAIDLKYDGKVERRELPPLTLDTLSMKYQFQFSPPKEGESEVIVTNGKKVTPYRYRLVKEETIETPAGKFATIHYVKIAEKGETKLELWLAKEQHYFPVRIVAEDKGMTLEQVLAKVSFD